MYLSVEGIRYRMVGEANTIRSGELSRTLVTSTGASPRERVSSLLFVVPSVDTY